MASGAMLEGVCVCVCVFAALHWFTLAKDAEVNVRLSFDAIFLFCLFWSVQLKPFLLPLVGWLGMERHLLEHDGL